MVEQKEQTVKKFRIEKREGKLVFITTLPHVLREETVDKETFKIEYENKVTERNKKRDEIAQVRKRLEEINFVADPELDKFIEMANKAGEYNKFKQLEGALEANKEMMALIEEQMRDMEAALPELLRNKEK
jgi:hypothetical protein